MQAGIYFLTLTDKSNNEVLGTIRLVRVTSN